jgi:hypothetical protein
MRRVLTDKDLAVVVRMRGEGTSTQAVADAFGVSKHTIKRYLSKLGVKFPRGDRTYYHGMARNCFDVGEPLEAGPAIRVPKKTNDAFLSALNDERTSHEHDA